jgi:hypothetical protein
MYESRHNQRCINLAGNNKLGEKKICINVIFVCKFYIFYTQSILFVQKFIIQAVKEKTFVALGKNEKVVYICYKLLILPRIKNRGPESFRPLTFFMFTFFFQLSHRFQN